MRKFSSYGPLNTTLHYYAPRAKLIAQVYGQLRGENPLVGGSYITVWAPRQTGKSWVMQEVRTRLLADPQFAVVKLNLQILQQADSLEAIRAITQYLTKELDQPLAAPHTLLEFEANFSNDVLRKPLILILDKFDALADDVIRDIVGVFRNIYLHRQQQIEMAHLRISRIPSVIRRWMW
jgi:hypothetical protein